MVVPPDEFNDVVEERCKIASVNFSGFKKWIRNTTDTEYECEYKPVSVDGKLRKCWCLSKLKQDVIDGIVAQSDKADDADTPIPSKTRTTAKFELADEQQPTNKALTALLSVDDIRVRNAVWNVWKSTNTNPDTLTAVQIQEYIEDAKNKIAKEN